MGELIQFKPRNPESVLATVLRLMRSDAPMNEIAAAVVNRHPSVTQSEFDGAVGSAREYLAPTLSGQHGGAA